MSFARHPALTTPHRLARAMVIAVLLSGGLSVSLNAQTTTATQVPLADKPIFSRASVPGNLALALSVEYPTASTPSYKGSYLNTTTYLGYFDPGKCYIYIYEDKGDPDKAETYSYFKADGAASSRTCSSGKQWSGNYLNWASMQSLDNFRWVLTGGRRVLQDETFTHLQKTFFGNQGTGYAPDKLINGTTTIQGAAPVGWSTLYTSIANRGRAMLFSRCAIQASPNNIENYTQNTTPSTPSPPNRACGGADPVYRVYINVRVCDSAPDSNNYHNCKQYGSIYRPEGLMQLYSDKLRYAAFGYLNDSNMYRDGGVLRAAMTFIGPTQPVPGAPPKTNPAPEWDGSNGKMLDNPASVDAGKTTTATEAAGYKVTVTNSGVMNYLNKFGDAAGAKNPNSPYKTYDPVSELYYAVTRYFRNKGDVPEYSSLSGAGSSTTMETWVDGFPVITQWRDPMLYSCQKNFILGIGDIYTHRDTNLPGSTIRTSDEPTMPDAVKNDEGIDVKKFTDMVGQLEGFTGTPTLGARLGGRNDSQFIAGLAYHTHTNDIRADLEGTQTINTYWMDVLEAPYESKNKYWLAAKYGGFTVPENFAPYDPKNSPDKLQRTDWNQKDEKVTGSNDYRPTNYFTANDPTAMKKGLEDAFAKIVLESDGESTTSYATASPNVTTGQASYGSTYSPKNWTGDVTAKATEYGADGKLTLAAAPNWSAASVLKAQSATVGWFSNTRKVVTYCDASSPPAGIAFTSTALGTCTTASKDNASVRRLNYDTFGNVTGVVAQSQLDFLNYLRGDSSKETTATDGKYRSRESLLGDILGSKVLPVAGPASPYSDETNPGYNKFKTDHAARKTVVYVGANDGMLHAFDGGLNVGTTYTSGGQELFAFVPSFVYGTSSSGPDSGLASLGKTAFTHHQLVNGPVLNFDIDFNRAGTPTATTSDWRTILIGGLGKGGRGYYALDVTKPSEWSSEAAVASKVLWEFPASTDAKTRAKMGYSYGEPTVVKTKKYGWVVIFSSGYNNDDGNGYFFFVNPKTGALLETVSTPSDAGSTSAPLNMAQQRAYVPDYSDYTADSVYAGDLQGNLWRLDLTSASDPYPTPVKIAELRNAAGDAQPVMTRPLIEVDPSTKRRYVLVGTGRLLADTDIKTASLQSFYAIADGTANPGTFWTSAPPKGSFPIKRTDLNANASTLAGISSAPASALGWYLDLSATTTTSTPATTSGSTTTTEADQYTIAERVDVNPDANFGIVAFAANLPNGSACQPNGTARIFAMRIATGKTVLTDASGALIPYANNTTGVITDIAIQRVNGRIRLNVGDRKGIAANVPGDLGSGLSLTRLNWREVGQE